MSFKIEKTISAPEHADGTGARLISYKLVDIKPFDHSDGSASVQISSGGQITHVSGELPGRKYNAIKNRRRRSQ